MASCDFCAYNEYDEEDEAYYCSVNMDEDDMARFVQGDYKGMSLLPFRGRIQSCTAPDVTWCRFRKILIILCFCPHIHRLLSMLSAPQIQQYTCHKKYNIRKERSLDTKSNVIRKTVPGGRCIQFK